ncbi:MAG: ABC transporter permease [Gammaproteobacteria bacterium]|nr:ABC transporter permease [Gammaproteobacteria bacterium]MDH4313905.1 ABC transporter permease [Gammaproteobacteria bacterium]MDH5213820.1 ABC transporter permease [Gammaproteobacteria bacterium]
MISYYAKLGLLSIRQNPVLSALMVAAIATGIGACMTIVNIDYVMSGNPIPHRSSLLYHVQLDSWDPYEAAEEPNEPPDQVTYLDGTALLKAGKARRQVLSYRTGRVIQPDGDGQLPFQVSSRSTSADFFSMFDVPFLYGSAWDKAADDSAAYVVVLGREVNEQLFGGQDPVGRNVVMNGDTYRVTGVLDNWQPTPKFYDVSNQSFGEVEEVYFPLSVSIAEELSSSGNTNCWKPVPETTWQAFLNSECVWMQLWVELHGETERSDYLAYLDAYVESQKAIGRFPRPLNNRLYNVMEWMQNQEVVESDVKVLLGLAVLFLVVCLLNTIGLLLAKIMRRAGDIGLRRALGASRNAVFAQYIVEAGLIGIVGGVAGIGMTMLGLQGIRILYGEFDFIDRLVHLDWIMMSTAIILAIVSALAAALYPTWRACGIHPASQLKSL